MRATGDCFVVAFRLVVDHPELVLVHGTVVGQGQIEGTHHPHAWCERTDRMEWPGGPMHEVVTCIDRANGNDIELPAALYYRIGQVYDVTIYERDEALRLALRHRHYGPWVAASDEAR